MRVKELKKLLDYLPDNAKVIVGNKILGTCSLITKDIDKHPDYNRWGFGGYTGEGYEQIRFYTNPNEKLDLSLIKNYGITDAIVFEEDDYKSNKE